MCLWVGTKVNTIIVYRNQNVWTYQFHTYNFENQYSMANSILEHRIWTIVRMEMEVMVYCGLLTIQIDSQYVVINIYLCTGWRCDFSDRFFVHVHFSSMLQMHPHIPYIHKIRKSFAFLIIPECSIEFWIFLEGFANFSLFIYLVQPS